MNDKIKNQCNDNFISNQFFALREEILALKERVIRIQSTAITGIPLLVAAGEKFNLDFVLIVSPIITAVVVLMLSFEQNSIMRAGRYIRKHIEPKLKSEDMIGWEEFLEKPEEKNRNAEKYFLSSVVISFVLYYLAGAILAYLKTKPKYGDEFGMLLAIFYMCILPFSVFFVLKNFKIGTK